RLGELLPVWRAELEAVGWPAPELAAAIDQAAAERTVTGPLTPSQLERLVTETLTKDGDLARRKVFTRADVIVAVAPHLYGRPVDEVRQVVDAVIASPETIPLARTGAARERAYSTASTIATE